MVKIISLFAFLFFAQELLSQTFIGNVVNVDKELLPNTNILIKNAETPDLISEFTTSKNDGSYAITINTESENIIIEFTKFGYETQIFQFKRSELGKEYRLDVELKESMVELEEVFIRDKPKIEVKEDTVNYKASAFLDGSERKVEDLLKKLPGIQVDEDGKIKYKGKAVEKVLLEGDDLFDYNYTMGTKNMNVDIVEQVQAIENFTENPLLRNIEDSDKVALNLKLKKNRMDFSGDGAFGYGIEDRHTTDFNVLAITRKLKNFSTISYNNNGENNTPYDYFSFKPSLEDQQISNLKAPKLINERIFTSGINNQRATINDNWFTSLNNIYKLSNRLSARIIFSYYKDQLDFFSSNISDYSFDDGSQLSILQNEEIAKKPEIYDGSLKLTWNSSKTSLLEFTSKWSNENIITNTNITTNNQNDLFTKLDSESFFTKQEILFTQKLNAKNVVQIKGLFSRNDVPQEFNLNPGLDFLTGEIVQQIENLQQSNYSKNHYELSSTLLGAKNKNKFQISASAKYTENSLISGLYQNQEILGDEFLNSLKYNLLETNIQGFYNLRLGKLSIKPSIEIKNYIWERNENSLNQYPTNNRFIFAPSLSLNYKLNDVMRLFANYNYDEKPPQETNLYSGYILTSNRSITRNLFSDEFQKSHAASLSYGIYDFYNQFSLTASLNYSEQKNNYFSMNNVSENLTSTDYFFLPEGNKNYGGNLNVEKYIPSLQTTFKISGNYAVSEYKNIVNNSDLRNNKMNSLFINFYGKTAFDFPINLQNELKISNFNSRSSENSEKLRNTTINNSFKILVKPNRFWFGSISFDYFQTSIENPNEYYFLDTMIRYRTPNKIWEFAVTGKNLTNNKFFEEIYVSDYYRSTSLQNLNRAYLIFGLSFSF